MHPPPPRRRRCGLRRRRAGRSCRSLLTPGHGKEPGGNGLSTIHGARAALAVAAADSPQCAGFMLLAALNKTIRIAVKTTLDMRYRWAALRLTALAEASSPLQFRAVVEFYNLRI